MNSEENSIKKTQHDTIKCLQYEVHNLGIEDVNLWQNLSNAPESIHPSITTRW